MKRKYVIHKNYGNLNGTKIHLVRTPSGSGKTFTTRELNAYIDRIGAVNFRYAR